MLKLFSLRWLETSAWLGFLVFAWVVLDRATMECFGSLKASSECVWLGMNWPRFELLKVLKRVFSFCANFRSSTLLPIDPEMRGGPPADGEEGSRLPISCNF